MIECFLLDLRSYKLTEDEAISIELPAEIDDLRTVLGICLVDRGISHLITQLEDWK